MIETGAAGKDYFCYPVRTDTNSELFILAFDRLHVSLHFGKSVEAALTAPPVVSEIPYQCDNNHSFGSPSAEDFDIHFEINDPRIRERQRERLKLFYHDHFDGEQWHPRYFGALLYDHHSDCLRGYGYAEQPLHDFHPEHDSHVPTLWRRLTPGQTNINSLLPPEPTDALYLVRSYRMTETPDPLRLSFYSDGGVTLSESAPFRTIAVGSHRQNGRKLEIEWRRCQSSTQLAMEHFPRSAVLKKVKPFINPFYTFQLTNNSRHTGNNEGVIDEEYVVIDAVSGCHIARYSEYIEWEYYAEPGDYSLSENNGKLLYNGNETNIEIPGAVECNTADKLKFEHGNWHSSAPRNSDESANNQTIFAQATTEQAAAQSADATNGLMRKFAGLLLAPMGGAFLSTLPITLLTTFDSDLGILSLLRGLLGVTIFGTLFAWTTAVIVGIPAHLLLQRFDKQRLWHYVVGGTLCAIPMWCIWFGPPTLAHLSDYNKLVWFPSAGAISGALFWWIAIKPRE